MKRIFFPLLTVLLTALLSVPIFASSEKPDDPMPAVEISYPSADSSVFGSLGDDFFSEGDFVAFDKESIENSSELFRNSIGSITNVALYGMLVVLGIFVVFEVIHAIAA